MITAEELNQMGYEYYSAEDEPKPLSENNPLWMVREFSRITQQLPNPALYAALIAEEHGEWHSEYLQDTTTEQLKELADLVYVTYGYALAKGWDLTEAVYRVHKNNIGRCIQPDGSIKRREDGKIMKNPNYPKVDLNDLV
jgi:predicted HAD superfamily Cof-like phosphohydrolase